MRTITGLKHSWDTIFLEHDHRTLLAAGVLACPYIDSLHNVPTVDANKVGWKGIRLETFARRCANGDCGCWTFQVRIKLLRQKKIDHFSSVRGALGANSYRF